MASGAKKTGPARAHTTQRDRFLKGSDEPVLRVMVGGGKRRFVWAVKNPAGGFKHVSVSETELRP